MTPAAASRSRFRQRPIVSTTRSAGTTIASPSGVWIFRSSNGLVIVSVCRCMLTTTPGPDVAPYHDRQIVLLEPGRAMEWLDLTTPEAELLRPLPAGRLAVDRVFPPAETARLF